MRAIIINDADARALLDQLKLAKHEGRVVGPNVDKLSEGELQQIRQDIHGHFHFVVSRWLQEQGAHLLR